MIFDLINNFKEQITDYIHAKHNEWVKQIYFITIIDKNVWENWFLSLPLFILKFNVGMTGVKLGHFNIEKGGLKGGNS